MTPSGEFFGGVGSDEGCHTGEGCLSDSPAPVSAVEAVACLVPPGSASATPPPPRSDRAGVGRRRCSVATVDGQVTSSAATTSVGPCAHRAGRRRHSGHRRATGVARSRAPRGHGPAASLAWRRPCDTGPSPRIRAAPRHGAGGRNWQWPVRALRVRPRSHTAALARWPSAVPARGSRPPQTGPSASSARPTLVSAAARPSLQPVDSRMATASCWTCSAPARRRRSTNRRRLKGAKGHDTSA